MLSVSRCRGLVLTAVALASVACSGNHAGDDQTSGASGGVTSAAPAAAGDYAHVPVYTSHVVKTDKMGPGEYAIDTSDSVDDVVAWFKANLPDQTSDTVTSDGAHLFYTKSGSTVDVEAETGHKFDPTDKARTTIGVQNAK